MQVVLVVSVVHVLHTYLTPFAHSPMAATTTTKAMVEEVLTAEGYSDKRAAKMDQNDFLCLLAAFNMKGLHFA